MATQRIKTTFQVRRGLSKEWWDVNPILAAGEPGLAIDTLELKWGNGVSHWRELESTNIQYVVDSPTLSDFPDVGRPDVLYKASEEKVLYQWNDTTKEYEPLSGGKTEASDLLIDIIDGGTANV